MSKNELLQMYDLLDDTGKTIVDVYIMANVVEMLKERIEELGLDNAFSGDGGEEA